MSGKALASATVNCWLRSAQPSSAMARLGRFRQAFPPTSIRAQFHLELRGRVGALFVCHADFGRAFQRPLARAQRGAGWRVCSSATSKLMAPYFSQCLVRAIGLDRMKPRPSMASDAESREDIVWKCTHMSRDSGSNSRHVGDLGICDAVLASLVRIPRTGQKRGLAPRIWVAVEQWVHCSQRSESASV